MKKRMLALTLAIMMLAAALPAVAADDEGYWFEPPADIVGLACEDAVMELMAGGMLKGYPDGTFRPDRSMTRAEAVTLISNRIHSYYYESREIGALPYSDIEGHWAVERLVQASRIGMLRGFEDGTYRPDAGITLGDFVTMCMRTLYYTEKMVGGAEGFWPKAVELGLVEAEADPDAILSRGQAAMIFNPVFHMELATPDGACMAYSETALWILEEWEPLRGFVLAGSVTEDSINGTPLADVCNIYYWDSALDMWGHTNAYDLQYNYVALYDNNNDAAADAILVIDRQDGPLFWDAESMEGVDFAGPYSIPYGQRLLEGHGLGGAADDYSNIVAQGSLASSTYWPIYDWYSTTSTETLTFLTGFKTTLQTNGWACGTTSALMALEWYNMRGDLNELDLSTLRDKVIDSAWRWGGYTDTQMLINMFGNLNAMSGHEDWTWESTYDFLDEDGAFDYDTYLSTDWILSHLSAGHPILVGWNSFGGHWQIIIGYDTMGTEGTADDVLLLADPYDTTDHLNDGVNIQSYERLYWEWSQDFDRDFGAGNDYGMPVVFVPWLTDGFDWQAIPGNGLSVQDGQAWARTGNTSDEMGIPYGDTAADLEASSYVYSKAQRGENGLAGPASSDWYRMADVTSPYYAGLDFYNYYESADTRDSLRLLEHFRTAQQASEWTCGPASLRMALSYYGMESLPSEFALAALREDDKEGATTLDGMIQMLEGLNAQGGDWTWLSTDDLDEDWNIGETNHNLEGGFVPWCIRHGIPVVIGWDEWGGHWMVIIGFDDMGTEDTQDDVIILADPYDTTDHCQDGYVIESWERLLYGWGASFDERGSEVFLVFGPQDHFEAMGLPVQ